VKQPLDAFFEQYYARHPVNATFTGMHAYDARLPDWSPDGRADDARELAALRAALAAAQPSLDHELACANLDVRSAEHASGVMVEKNPALWTGEAIFGAVSLMLRPFAPRSERLENLAARLAAVEPFLASMRGSITTAMPTRWAQRAQRECVVAEQLFDAGLDAWLDLEAGDGELAAHVRAAALQAQTAFHSCTEWLASQSTVDDRYNAGEELFGVLLRRGHFCEKPANELLREANDAIECE
jgi:hypothetical protein